MSAIVCYNRCVLYWKNVCTTIRSRVNDVPNANVLEATWYKRVETRKVEIPYWPLITPLIMCTVALSLVLEDSMNLLTMGWVSSLQLHLFVQYFVILLHVVAEVIWRFTTPLLRTMMIKFDVIDHMLYRWCHYMMVCCNYRFFILFIEADGHML
jgi:hypothetical protein